MPSNWHGDEFFAGIQTRMIAGVEKGGGVVKEKMRDSISTQGPPRSQPGEPPHIDSGELISSIQLVGPAVQGEVVVVSVGSDVPHAIYLEFGTSRMAARPFMARSIYDNKEEIGSAVLSR